MKKYTRNTVFTELTEYDVFAKEHDYIEVTEWKNGEGFDVEINGVIDQTFQISYGCFKALKKCVKALNE
jgi:hypothetical protein